jgi:hypothetical protein
MTGKVRFSYWSHSLMIIRVHSFFIVFLLAFFGALSCSSVSAGDWAEKMFKQKMHDFGTVSRNAKTEHAFVIENCFEEDVHIASVRSSCGCTKPVISKSTLKSWEKGEIIAQFNTKTFLGQKNASITVVIDRPYYAEVNLLVSGKIRSDIVVEPGEVNFGDVDVGMSKEIDIKISYAGRPDWAIKDVRGDTDNLEVRLSPATRKGQMLSYVMNVRLKETTPVGELQEEITVVTNDLKESTFSLPVQARVIPPISITPKVVSVGDVKLGQQVQQKLLIRAKKPFSIVGIDCEDPRFAFTIPQGDKSIQVIPMTFTGGSITEENVRSIKQAIRVRTSLGDDSSVEATINGRMID